VFAAAGLVATIGVAALTLGEPKAALASYGAVSPAAAVLESLTGAALFVAATALAADGRRRGVALATFFLAAAWSGAVWAGWANAPPVLRAGGMLLVPMVAPAALVVTASLVRGRSTSCVGFALAGLAIACGVVLWLVRDPYLDRYCWRDCLAHSFAPLVSVDGARTMMNATLGVGVACGVLTVALACVGLAGGGPNRRENFWAFVPAIGVGCTVAVSDLVLRVEPAEDPARVLFVALFYARAVTLVGFALGLVAVALRPRLVRAAIARLASVDGVSAVGGLDAALADALGVPNIRIGYPLPEDGSVVDSEGRPMSLGADAISIVRGGEVVALVGAAAGAPRISSLDRELGSAARLALANERLRAEQSARLRELVRTRRRIVAAGDAERRRLERDLHDGAQQRLLALSFDLRVAMNRAKAAGRPDIESALTKALAYVTDAARELRDVAHGIFPAVLATSGLVPALLTLVDTLPLILVLGVSEERRFSAEIEGTAYAVVAEGALDTGPLVRVTVAEEEGFLVVVVDDAAWPRGVVAVADRVGAVGGTISRSESRLEARLPLSAPTH
jgi:signal transduction histidine kinase